LARTFYRIVKEDPPGPDDFKSYLERGVPMLKDDPETRRLAEGPSVYATLAQARRAARSQPFLGRFVAELVIPNDAPLTFERTGRKPGHHTLWARPRQALSAEVARCVVSVVRLERSYRRDTRRSW